MSAGFTPGEWGWKSQNDHIVIGVGDWYHATVVCAAEGDHEGAAEAVANARLIAAAPDMYEALKRAEDHLGGAHVSLASNDPDFVILEAIRAALAKAEGAQ